MSKKAKKTISDKVQVAGIVVRTTGGHCWVLDENGVQHKCVVKGKFRLQDTLRSTNPVTVGDKVKFLLAEESGELGVVAELLPRENFLLRKSINLSHKVHVLCANIDQAVLIFTLKSPRTTTGFANRFLVTAEAYHIPAIIFLNKIDLLESDKEWEDFEQLKGNYEKAGYKVIPIAAREARFRELVMQELRGKTSFIGGHSGSGKSTLLNLLDPDLEVRTGEISNYTNKGMHTTTASEMFFVEDARIIDSPGIKEMGLVDFDKSELGHYFPEIRALLGECKFNDCKHQNEPHCAVIEAVKAGELSESRYMSYLRILTDIEEEEMEE